LAHLDKAVINARLIALEQVDIAIGGHCAKAPLLKYVLWASIDYRGAWGDRRAYLAGAAEPDRRAKVREDLRFALMRVKGRQVIRDWDVDDLFRKYFDKALLDRT